MSLYAVVETGGKQYRVQPGQIVQVEKLEGEVGTSLTFDKVLFSSANNAENAQVWIGKPYLAGAKVQAEFVGQGRGEKLLLVKMKRRKQYRRTQGHRQELSQLLVTSVDNGAGNTAALSSDEKKAVLAKFQSHLKEKGPASTPKTLGSRKRMHENRMAAHKAGGAAPAAAAKKAPAKKPSTAAKSK